MNQSSVKDEVWATVQALNRLWTVENKADDLKQYFHERMIAITPTDRLRREGREACVGGWKAFTETATIHYWKELEPKIELFNDDKCAIVTYYFDMSFDIGGQTVKMGGRDMYTLISEGGRWWVIADQFSPYPQ